MSKMTETATTAENATTDSRPLNVVVSGEPAKPVSGKMPVKDRVVLLVTYYDEHRTGTRAEVAAALGCSEGVVKYSTVDARTALAEKGLEVVWTKTSYAVTSAVAPAKPKTRRTAKTS